MVMDIAESLVTAADFVPSEGEAVLVVNGSAFPQPPEGAHITGWEGLSCTTLAAWPV